MQKIVIVGGGGHVGLPLALVLADCGFDVTSLDINEDTVKKINSGAMPFLENGAQDLLTKVLKINTFRASINYEVIQSADVVVVVIGTPVNEDQNPDSDFVIDAIAACMPYMDSSQLVILRSTVFPGVTSRVIKLFENAGLAPDVTFCPERILEGHALVELRTLPQIVGANNLKASNRAVNLFSSLGVQSIVVTPEEAELAKLFTNAWRYIKFAAANQFWLMSNESGLDFTKIREAIIRDYPRASDLPNAGFTAGPCLLKDTVQLAAFSEDNYALGHSAIEINEGLPNYVIQKIEQKIDLTSQTVGILGMAFKAESDDIRSSLAYKLKSTLQSKAKEVLTSDPFVSVDAELVGQDELLNRSDIIIIAAPHETYRELKTNKLVIDIWNLLGQGNLI